MALSESITGQFQLQTRLFSNALVNLEADCTTRPSDTTNHLAWLAGHLVSTRVMLVNLLGGSARDPHPDIFGKGKGIDESLAYPSLKRSMADWEAVAPLLTEALKKVDDKVLAAKAPFPTPMGEKLGEVIAFFAHHEAYHIGQMGILRKYFGKEAMKYN